MRPACVEAPPGGRPGRTSLSATRGAVEGLVVEPDCAADGAVGHGGVRGGGEPLAEGATLVGLDVAEGDPAQPAQVHDPGGGLGDGREQGPLAAVEEQGLVGVHQELIEGESLRAHRGEKRREAVDSLSDLVDLRFHAVDTARQAAECQAMRYNPAP